MGREDRDKGTECRESSVVKVSELGAQLEEGSTGWDHICMNQKVEQVIGSWLRNIEHGESMHLLDRYVQLAPGNVDLGLGSLLIRETST